MSGLKRLFFLAGLAMLAGCARAPAPPEPVAGMRDRSVPLYSMAGFDPARLTGRWVEVAHLAPAGAAPCRGGGLNISGQGADLAIRGQLCQAGRLVPVEARARVSGDGRLQLQGEAEAWWVIWADYDNRSLILATPSGSFASVLDRGQMPSDRLRAAREMLGYNGYPVALLR